MTEYVLARLVRSRVLPTIILSLSALIAYCPASAGSNDAAACRVAADALDQRARVVRQQIVGMGKPMESSGVFLPDNIFEMDEKAKVRQHTAQMALTAHLQDLEDIGYQLRLCGRE
ncbi:MAG: hypothetical protein JWQ74_3549 [Marmoricola sp.]|nr:hypothetical protein [Marmoricola sp.]